MSPPLLEPAMTRVIDHLVEALRGIRTTDGCWYDVKPTSVTTEPQELLLVPETELPFLLVVPQPEGRVVYRPAHQMEEDLVVAILGRVDVVDPQDPRAKLTAGHRLVADIERRLTLDITRGGLVVDTRLRRPRILYGLGQDPIVLVEQLADCRRHRTYGAPES